MVRKTVHFPNDKDIHFIAIRHLLLENLDYDLKAFPQYERVIHLYPNLDIRFLPPEVLNADPPAKRREKR